MVFGTGGFVYTYFFSYTVIQLVALVSNILVLIVALSYADDIDLYVFDKGGNSTKEVVAKG